MAHTYRHDAEESIMDRIESPEGSMIQCHKCPRDFRGARQLVDHLELAHDINRRPTTKYRYR